MASPDRRYYEQAARRESLLFRVCAYLRHDDCRQCPATVSIQGDVGQPMCHALAEELVAIILEDFAERSEDHFAQDNDALPRP